MIVDAISHSSSKLIATFMRYPSSPAEQTDESAASISLTELDSFAITAIVT